MANERTEQVAKARAAEEARQASRERRPPWTLISKGWLALLLLLLAWAGVYLLWHGIGLVAQF